MGLTKKATKAQMDLAIHLFEMGFPAEAVEVAVERFSNVEDAVVWLTGDVLSDAGDTDGAGEAEEGGSESAPASSVAASSIATPLAAPVTDIDIAARYELAAHSGRASLGLVPTPAEDPEERRSLKGAAEMPPPAESNLPRRSNAVMISVPTPSRLASLQARSSADASAPREHLPIEEQPIEERDARDFWRQKAALWQQLLPNLQAHAASNLVGGPPWPPASASREPRSGSKRPLPGAETGDAPEADGAAEPPPHKRSLSATASVAATPNRVMQSPACMTPLSPTALRFNRVPEACGICMEKSDPCRAVRLTCGHGWYCADCLTGFAEARLSDGLITMPCPEPGCPSELGEAHLRKLLPSELMEKLLERRLDLAVAQDASLRPCPTPNCTMLVALDGTRSRLSCPLCKKTSCFACGAQPWHKGLTCEQYAEKMKSKISKDEALFEQWLEETGTKRCPRCEVPVSKQCLEKQSSQQRECHKMCCRQCKVLFCFKCLAILEDGFRCGCTSEIHGFINPEDGTRIEHKKKRRGRGGEEAAIVAPPPAAAEASSGRGGASGGRGRGRGRGS